MDVLTGISNWISGREIENAKREIIKEHHSQFMSTEISMERVKASNTESMIADNSVDWSIRDQVSELLKVLKLFFINIASDQVIDRSSKQSEDQEMSKKWVMFNFQMTNFLH
jgi:hypothetical protein